MASRRASSTPLPGAGCWWPRTSRAARGRATTHARCGTSRASVRGCGRCTPCRCRRRCPQSIRARRSRGTGRAPPPNPPVPRAKLASAAAASLAAVAPRAHALCHHDLHHRNVIDAGELVFVDWEYAGRGEPLLDLAAFAAYHDFDAPRRAALLAAYEAGGPPPQRLADAHEVGGASPERFAAACTLFDCLQALWYDAADAWHTLGADARAALIQRLALSPRRSARAAACAGTPRRPP